MFEPFKKGKLLLGSERDVFARRAAQILGTLNAVHPFREGNGRAQREFLRELALENGYWLSWARVSREEMLEASEQSFLRGDNSMFEKLLLKTIGPITGG